MPLYEITSDSILPVPETSFGAERVRERADLQRLLRAKIQILASDTMVVAEEFADWEDSKRRIDLLGLDKDANLVVIELKRTDDGGHMELQALRYAAMVSAMTFSKLVDVHTNYLRKLGDQHDARSAILNFLEWDEPNDDRFGQKVRVILAAPDFSKELTSAVIWLNKHALDIRCIRLKPYTLDRRLLIDVQQIIPLPEAAEYQVQIAEKEQSERKGAERYGLHQRFWTSLLARARLKTSLHANISPSEYNYISTSAGVPGLGLNYVILQHEGRVELWINRGSRDENKSVFDALAAEKQSIEAAFGGALEWQRLENKDACRIAVVISEGGYRDEESWPQVQDAMIDGMIRLGKALEPHMSKLRVRG